MAVHGPQAHQRPSLTKARSLRGRAPGDPKARRRKGEGREAAPTPLFVPDSRAESHRQASLPRAGS